MKDDIKVLDGELWARWLLRQFIDFLERPHFSDQPIEEKKEKDEP